MASRMDLILDGYDPASQVYLIFAVNSRANIVTLESILELFAKIENSCPSVRFILFPVAISGF